MNGFIINAEDFVQTEQIIQRIRYSLRNKVGFSLVRIGDAENQIMAQGGIYPEKNIEHISWANDESYTGITLPNYAARDKLIASVRDADMVGVLNEDELCTWKPLTEKVFSLYNIKPRQLCYAFVNTSLPGNHEFISLMKHYRLLLIGELANEFAAFLDSRCRIKAADAISIKNYHDIPVVIEQASHIQYDMALISAGSNAVILATELARQGKVALDFGRAMDSALWKKKGLPFRIEIPLNGNASPRPRS